MNLLTAGRLISVKLLVRFVLCPKCGMLCCATVDSTANDGINLSYGLSVGLMETAFGKAFFKEGHDDGWGHYSVCFRDKGIAMIIITNNDNGESIFRELLEVAIGDRFTPWEWEYYIPYNLKK